MTILDPDTGLLITCEPWEYAELCKRQGWIKTTYETNTTPIQKYDFTTRTVPSQEYEVGEIPPEELEKQKKRPYFNKEEKDEQ